ncbi:MAG: dihydropteroate synthase [Candidatus Omnitrophota bacterium]|nr:dihydropteroate synthase [Candidatus Omnitrophota bacterium]
MKTKKELTLPARGRIQKSQLDIDACGFHLAFSKKTYVMGVLNVTPDSFSDGGRFFDKRRALRRGLEMAREGAGIIDVGGESTRPGARDVSFAEEIDRVVPVIMCLAKELGVPISVDTRKAKVAEEAIKAGASIVNDVSGLRHDRKMGPVVAGSGAVLIATHMKGAPQDMQRNPVYRNLIKDVISGLRESIRLARLCGIDENKIIIDPGIGFGKAVWHNLEILNRLDEFKALRRPICVGTSRKSFIGKVLNIDDTGMRMAGTIATSVAAILNGANIIRAHDVKEAREAAAMADAILKAGAN